MDREIEENYDVENKKGIMYLFWFFSSIPIRWKENKQVQRKVTLCNKNRKATVCNKNEEKLLYAIKTKNKQVNITSQQA